MNQKVYYVANGRMPSEKAYGIQMAKMCEALIEEGVDLTLIVPRRGKQESLRKFYDLRVEVPTVWLPALELHRYKRLGYVIMSLSFCASCVPYLWWKKIRGERFILYTVDLDRYSSSVLPLVSAPLFSEMHGAKPNTLAQRFLFAHVRGILAINAIIVKELKETFSGSLTRFLVEPNGVDVEAFAPQNKDKARSILGLPPEGPVALYTGRFFEWKGLEIIPQAAALTPDIRWQVVGGTRETFETVVKDSLPDNLYFAGGRPHQEMPLWVAAADAVVVLGTKRDEQSYRWTSPMKLFEYLAAGRPIVASATPAIQEVVSEHEALLYEPDSAVDLAQKVRQAVGGGAEVESRTRAAEHAAQNRTWSGRAERVVHFVESILNEPIHRA